MTRYRSVLVQEHIIRTHRLLGDGCVLYCSDSLQASKVGIFYILLTVHLDVILVNDQLDALFSMYLFHASTCFE
jgi:hypothetical protein